MGYDYFRVQRRAAAGHPFRVDVDIFIGGSQDRQRRRQLRGGRPIRQAAGRARGVFSRRRYHRDNILICVSEFHSSPVRDYGDFVLFAISCRVALGFLRRGSRPTVR